VSVHFGRGQTTIRNFMTEPLRIVVICKMNRCRSPIGEASFRRLASGHEPPLFEVQSAGIQTQVGLKPMAQAVEAADRINLDASEIRSTPLSDSVLDWGTLFLGMERIHALEVCNRRPDLYHRTFTLKDLARRSALFAREEPLSVQSWLRLLSESRNRMQLIGRHAADDIEDPTGRGMRAHRIAAKEIDTAARSIVRNCFRNRA
jgi:protein-tyrosine-phosphatase